MATQPSPSTQTFHHFPRLPAELRCQIWAYVIPESFTKPSPALNQYIIIVAKADNSIEAKWRDLPRRLHPLFFVNREARSEVARVDGGEWFTFEFRGSYPGEPTLKACTDVKNGGKKIYFNKDKEVFLIRRRAQLGGWQWWRLGEDGIF